MTIISSPISKDDFNKMYTQRIQNYNQSLKLNLITYFAASVGANTYLQALASQQIKMPQVLDESQISDILTYIDKGRVPSSSVIQKIINEYPHVEVDHADQYIFLGDIDYFCSTFFPGILPSITKVIIEHLVFNKVVNVFGSATKRFLLLKNWDISDTGIDTIASKINTLNEDGYVTFSDLLKKYVNIVDESIQNYQFDQQYLLNIVDSLSKRVIELESALEIQQKEGIDGYLLRWH